MKMRIRQRMLSWFDSFDVTDDMDEKLFTVEGKFGWGRCFHIIDRSENHVATLKQVTLSFLPKFDMYLGGSYWGSVRKEFSLFRPRFQLDVNGWRVEGNWLEWDYDIADCNGRVVATVSKEVLNWTDTYVIETERSEDALGALMIVLAIDAEKASRD